MNKPVEIAVGILRDSAGRILIARRPPGTLGAGKWEFPGGKHEPGETMQVTLTRELEEEIGITPLAPRHLIRMNNELTTQTVHLHVWLVSDWKGEPQGREGQQLAWCPEAELTDYDLLPGNRTLINALRLPSHYAITPDIAHQERRAWLQSLQAALDRGISLLRLRAPSLDDTAYAELAAEVVARARATNAQVLLDRTPEMVTALGADGLHWPAERAAQERDRPVSRHHWFAVSAHDEAQLQTALPLGADFAVLSPVHTTASHPQRPPLGWGEWQRLRGDLGIPVYALGGLNGRDLAAARARNAQGIAAIRAFWGVMV